MDQCCCIISEFKNQTSCNGGHGNKTFMYHARLTTCKISRKKIQHKSQNVILLIDS